MKILFVAMADSIHTARHIKQLEGQGWDLHLFPSLDTGGISPALENITVYPSFYARDPALPASVRTKGIEIRFPIRNARYRRQRDALAYMGRSYLQRVRPNYRVKGLAKLIQKLQPDIVHSLELQNGAYIMLGVRELLGAENMPVWMVQNWGSDIYLFRHIPEHQDNLRHVLEYCDYYWCECERDVRLAVEIGLDPAKSLGVLPNVGGLHLEQYQATTPPSQRRRVLLKAYQHWAGRALVGLQAIRLCADILQDYTITLYSITPDVKLAAQVIQAETGLKFEYITHIPHEEMLRIYGESRAYIGLSISDGFSTSMVEAMAMGTFPIQSDTACTDEWFTDGESGLKVPPEDPHAIAAALRRVLTDDALVDSAAEINQHTAQQKLDYTVVQSQVLDRYRQVMATL